MSSDATTTTETGSNWDVVVPLGIIGIVLMMVMPIPAVVLDVLLAFSVAFVGSLRSGDAGAQPGAEPAGSGSRGRETSMPPA